MSVANLDTPGFHPFDLYRKPKGRKKRKPEPRCSTCANGPCVQCKHLRECRPDNCKWEGK